MQKQDEEFGVNSKENADNKANPEFDVNKVEQQKETEKKQVEETQEKLDKAKQEIANLENPEKQAEIAAAENSLESDFWPPLDFDDTTEYAQANI